MKLCFIGDASGYHVGRWIRYFGRTGHETHCISTAPAEIPGVKVHHVENKQTAFGLRHLFYFRYYSSVRRLIREIEPDVVHGLQINLYSYMAMRSGYRPYVITPFGGDVLVRPKESALDRHLAQYCLTNASLITTDADHIQDTLVELGADRAAIRVVYFATDVDQYRPMPKDEALVAKLGIEGKTCVISMRHLMPIYNIETLIRSIPAVRAEVPNIAYLIVSRGPEEDMLKSLADSLGVSDSIRWLGFLPGEELPKYVNLGDIYVSTSLSDAGLAASTGEAMACGLPAVITDFGDNRHWVADGRNGFLFPMKDHEALADRIISLAADPELRSRMGSTNRRTVEDRYNWAKEMARMEQLYQELAEQRGRNRNGR